MTDDGWDDLPLPSEERLVRALTPEELALIIGDGLALIVRDGWTVAGVEPPDDSPEPVAIEPVPVAPGQEPLFPEIAAPERDNDPGEDGGGLFGDDEQFKEAWQNWGGMPQFEMKDLEPASEVVVKFQTLEDRKRFAELVGQPLERWRAGAGIWYPAIQIGSYWDKRYRDASAETEKAGAQ